MGTFRFGYFLLLVLMCVVYTSLALPTKHRFSKLGFGEEWWRRQQRGELHGPADRQRTRHGNRNGRPVQASGGQDTTVNVWQRLDSEFYDVSGETPESAEIVSAGLYKDMAGDDIHAHGGGIYAENGTYYWFGTSQKILPGELSDGINVYKSTDLQHWEFGAKVFKNTSITVPLQPQKLYRIERPKVIYNKKTETYVMYFHLDDSSFGLRMVGVATSKTVMGEYQFVAGWKPDGQDSFDMSLFYDDQSDDAYLVRSVRNQFAGISKLTDDFLNTTGITSQGPRIEGQAIFRRNGKYYMIGSHLTGWSANPAVMSVADKTDTLVDAKWTVLGNPTGDSTTFHSQSTFVLTYTHPSGKVLNMFMADRWKAPDVKDADYLWLPFVEESGKLNITYVDTWKVKDY
ncbi:uncharacterized protein LOC135804712 isoform X1 [Sycon ciliatum]|uniref:uncharacterized protein LOC135804712 isoform X1 n=1 Tax=Sycon ciliatum TaxID=27933 RepID=UPI0031F60565